MLLVNEIFETIQGEATFTGTPAVFIRLQGCPVGCAWCDTKHTWYVEPEEKTDMETVLAKEEDDETFAEAQAKDLVKLVSMQFRAKHIVITGGEPCLYDLTEITKRFIDAGYTVQIETSATHEIKCDDRTFVTISPKINMLGGFKILPSAVARADEIKHPVGKPRDVELLKKEVLSLAPDAAKNVWLQPLSQSKKATALCVEICTENNWRISVQTHKYIDVR